MQNYHLIPAGSHWTLKNENTGRSIGEFSNKKEALDACIEFMRGRNGSLKIHKADGTFEEERTYPRASDPAATPG